MTTIEEAMGNLSEWIEAKRTNIEPLETHLVYRVAFNTDSHREAVFHRFIELIESTYILFKEKKLIGAIVNARSAQETLSVLWFINSKLNTLSNTKDLSHYLETMNRLSFGFAGDEKFPEKINILTCINAVDKNIDIGFRRNYDILSEYAHPNYSGTLGTYTKPNDEAKTTEVGSYPRSTNHLESIIESTLIVCISLLSPLHDEYSDLLNKLTDLCIELHDQEKLSEIFYKKT